MITKILQKYKAMRNYYPEAENPKDTSINLQSDILEKWKDHIPQGWYGFDMGGCHSSWFYIVDDFLDYLLTIDPKLEIHQVKLKWGGLRFYVEIKGRTEEEQEFVDLQAKELEEVLFDEKLIY